MCATTQLIQPILDQFQKEISEDLKNQLVSFFKNHSDQLRKVISEEVNIQLEEFLKQYKPAPPPIYYTRREVSKKFDVDLSTIHNWCKSGKLKPLGLGSRVYFLAADIEASLIPLNPQQGETGSV